MRRGRIFFYLAFILILALVAVAVVYFRFLQPTQTTQEILPTPTPIEMVEVVVVTQQVQRGSMLDETVLSLVPIPRDVFIQGYFTDLAGVVGRRARVDLDANMLLTSGMVVDTTEQLSDTGSTAALQIPRGMVAVSIPIDKLSSVSYAIRPGDHVNVIVSLQFVDLDADFQTILPNQNRVVVAPVPPDPVTLAGETLTAVTGDQGNIQGRAEIDPLLEQTFFVIPSETTQRPRPVAQTLLQDAIVLGVGEFPAPEEEQQEQAPEATPTPQPEAPAADEQAPQPTPPPIRRPDVVTLIVTPQDAVTLNYLVNLITSISVGTPLKPAKLTLALRSSDDDTRVQTEAATLDFLLQQYNIPVPVKLPYGTEPRVGGLPQVQPAPTVEPAPEQ
jgi:Flp pilus assembly protein CpaB